MRFTSLAGGLLIALGSIALAAEGDDLVVTGDGVNLRARPQAGAPVLLQVYRAEPAVELAREGEWVRVRLPERDTAGWIHGSLLAHADGRPLSATAPAVPVQPSEPAQRAAAPVPTPQPEPQPQPQSQAEPEPPAAASASGGAPAAGEPGSELAVVGTPGSDAAMASFRDTVSYLNERALAAAGIELFVDVEVDDAAGVARVVATDAWQVVPAGGRQSYLNTLLDRWSAAVGGGPARVEIVDESGRVLSEKSAP